MTAARGSWEILYETWQNGTEKERQKEMKAHTA